MFRKKENEPGRPVGLAEHAADNPLHRTSDFARSSQSEPPRRPIDLHGPGRVASSLAAQGERQPEQPGERQSALVSGDGKRLIVGSGISLAGEITACDRLVVEGSVQVTLNDTRAIEITESGRFTNGKAEVEEAEISGTYEGELTVKRRLHIRATGQVRGTVRYGEIEIERGGKLSGSVSMLDDEG